MSSAKSKAISEVNLEEFERRLRAAGAPQAGVEDPLSELTRLVNTIAAERPRTEKVVDIASARMPKSEPFPHSPQREAPSPPPAAQPSPAPVARAAPVAPPARVAPPAGVAPPARVAPPAPIAPAARVAPPARVLKPAAATAPATLPNRSAPPLRASFDETPVPAVEHPDSDGEAIAAET